MNLNQVILLHGNRIYDFEYKLKHFIILAIVCIWKEYKIHEGAQKMKRNAKFQIFIDMKSFSGWKTRHKFMKPDAPMYKMYHNLN